MCGIAGFIDPRGRIADARRVLTGMHLAIAHRGPDDADVWFDQTSGVGLAHRRLAILDLSPDGRQPMRSESGRFTIVFNGEVFNFLELRKDLEALGSRFRSHSDTEVMLAAFEHWGVEASVKRFVGMFAFAVWDNQRRIVTLCRDRVGIKPLQYGTIGGVTAFVSELRSLAAMGTMPDVDQGAMASYLTFGFVPAPATIFEGIRKLPPGHLLEIRADGSFGEPTAFWSVADRVRDAHADPFRGDEREAMDLLDSTLRESIRLRMIADVPLGAFLSGGTDSSLVVALMQAQSSRPVQTFTIGFPSAERGSGEIDESSAAEETARVLGTEHTTIPIGDLDVLSEATRMGELYDEPFADTSQIPTYIVCRAARKHVTVAISGDGGDELFGGYTAYLASARSLDIARRLPFGGRSAVRLAAAALSFGPADRAAASLTRLLPGRFRLRSPGAVVRGIARWTGMTDRAEILALHRTRSAALAASLMGGVRVSPLNEPAWARIAQDDLVRWLMATDIVTWMAEDVLCKVDRASMAVALEVRVPILDHRVVELSLRLPRSMLLRGGVGKWILRKLLGRYVPPAIVDRPKRGFDVPIDRWLRGPLAPWAEDLLSPARLTSRGLVNADTAVSLWSRFRDDSRQPASEIWMLLMLEAWNESRRGWSAEIQRKLQSETVQ